MCGGAAGAVSRFAMNASISAHLVSPFPWGILAINVVGGLSMGLLQGAIARSGKPCTLLYSLLGTGFLGGFTTFSHFSLNTFDLFTAGDFYLTAVNVLANAALCIVAAGIGYTLTGAHVAGLERR